MRRIHLISTIAIILVGLIFAYSQSRPPSSQTVQATTIRRIHVDARTISGLPSAKKYVVDLTQSDVKYDFDVSAGLVKFNRVMVRTTQGEFPIGSFLEKRLLKDKLAGFKYASQSFTLGTPPTGTLQSSPRTSTGCGREICTCRGEEDCQGLNDALYCLVTFCAINPITKEVICSCIRQYPPLQ